MTDQGMAITWKHREGDFPRPWDLETKITIFYERVYGWQLNVADICANSEQTIPHSDFAVLQILLSYFETIAKYEAGFVPRRKEGKSEQFFKKGVHSVFPRLVSENPGHVEHLLDTLYSKARCGLYHSSMTGVGVAIGAIDDKAIALDSAGSVLVINTHRLPGALKQHLAEYRDKLLEPSNSELRRNFEKRFDFDHRP